MRRQSPGPVTARRKPAQPVLSPEEEDRIRLEVIKWREAHFDEALDAVSREAELYRAEQGRDDVFQKGRLRQRREALEGAIQWLSRLCKSAPIGPKEIASHLRSREIIDRVKSRSDME
jgi:hypothetical protein